MGAGDFFLRKVGDSESWTNRIDVKFLRFMKMEFLFFWGCGCEKPWLRKANLLLLHFWDGWKRDFFDSLPLCKWRNISPREWGLSSWKDSSVLVILELYDGPCKELYTGWWLQAFFVFTPNLGEMIQFGPIIFRRGWFNHQLVYIISHTDFSSWLLDPEFGEARFIWRLKPLERSGKMSLEPWKRARVGWVIQGII